MCHITDFSLFLCLFVFLSVYLIVFYGHDVLFQYILNGYNQIYKSATFVYFWQNACDFKSSLSKKKYIVRHILFST